MIVEYSQKDATRVVIYRTSSIGDVILALANLDALARSPRPFAVTWIGRDPALSLVPMAHTHIRVLVAPKDQSIGDMTALIGKIKDAHLLIDLQCNLRSRMLLNSAARTYSIPLFSADKSSFARSRLVLEARLRGRRKSLPTKVMKASQPQYKMMLQPLQEGLDYLAHRQQWPQPVPCLDAVPRLPKLTFTASSAWHKELAFSRWLAVVPGASYPTKQAPADLFTQILAGIQAKRKDVTLLSDKPSSPLGLLFLGDETDRRIALDIEKAVSWDGPVLNLAGRLTLWESVQALSAADCLLSNDSAMTHISEALATPVAVLFGPTVEAFGFAPRLPGSKAFSAPIGCRPCSKHGKTDCRFGDKQCFSRIPKSAVIDFIVLRLAEAAALSGAAGTNARAHNDFNAASFEGKPLR